MEDSGGDARDVTVGGRQRLVPPSGRKMSGSVRLECSENTETHPQLEGGGTTDCDRGCLTCIHL